MLVRAEEEAQDLAEVVEDLVGQLRDDIDKVKEDVLEVKTGMAKIPDQVLATQGYVNKLHNHHTTAIKGQTTAINVSIEDIN